MPRAEIRSGMHLKSRTYKIEESFCNQHVPLEHGLFAIVTESQLRGALSGRRSCRDEFQEPCAPGRADSKSPNPEATHGGPHSAAATQQGCDTRKRCQRATVSTKPLLRLHLHWRWSPGPANSSPRPIQDGKVEHRRDLVTTSLRATRARRGRTAASHFGGQRPITDTASGQSVGGINMVE